MAPVSISELTKAFGNLEILHGIDIEIPDGEFVVLVGPSGCGKSTLLRMIAGLEQITSGTMRIGERVVNELPPKDRDIAMVFQNYALYPHMTVAENMSFALRLQKRGQAEIDAAVARAADILGLQGLLDRLPKQLSGGQRQRVAMGRAIVRDPQVFLFDEPLSNLDAKLRTQMRTEIKTLHHRLKTTTIFVTHDQIEAMTMADRIVVMRDGRVEQIGTPLELYDIPANLFVASFIGSPAMNFLGGKIENGRFTTAAGQLLDVTTDDPDQPATLGIRPENLSVAVSSIPGALKAHVVVVEPTGAETVLTADADGVQITAVLRERYDFEPGDEVLLTLDKKRAYFFDSEGQNLASRDKWAASRVGETVG